MRIPKPILIVSIVLLGAAMSDAFDTGKFPEPSNVDASDPDSTAAELAHKVSLKDENSACFVNGSQDANSRGVNGRSNGIWQAAAK